MRAVRSAVRALLVLLLVAFAAPGFAASPEKKFSVAMSPNLLDAGGVTLTATIKNETPNGNSSINSLILALPPGYTLASPAPTTNWGGQITTTPTSVSISNMSPLKPQQSFVLTLRVTAPASTSLDPCTVSVWNAQAWTGSSFSGDTFRQLFPPEFNVDSTTSVGTPQQLTFSTQPPAEASKGDTIPVGVKVTTSCGPVKSAQVVISVAGCTTGCLSGTTTGTTDANGIANFTNLKILIPGTYTLTATSTGFPSVSSTIRIFDGLLNCEPTPPFNFDSGNGITDPTQSGYAAGSRGFWNKDGFACVPLLYTFTNTILVDNTVHLSWDMTTGQHPAFTYTMTWKTEDVDNAANLQTQGASNFGWPIPRRVQVAWNTTGAPAFVDALACVSPALPAPYATLSSAIGDTASTTIVVSAPPTVPTYVDPVDHTTKNYPVATIPSTVPFSVVIGTERMLVTAKSGNTWTVTRGYAGTTKATHDASAYVMSTPLPVDLNTGVQVPMCVVNHGWMAAGFNPVTGIAQVRYFTTVIDIGDGWVRVGQ